MRRLSLVCLLLFPVCGLAQAMEQAPAQNCRWQADDPSGKLANSNWAAPDFDDSAWRPSQGWHPDPAIPRLWVRCHVDLARWQLLTQPALMVDFFPAFDLFVNGEFIASSGDTRSASFTLNNVRNLPLRLPQAPPANSIESSDAATLSIGNEPVGDITRMQSEGDAFTGLSTGQINVPDVVRTGARTLQLKLFLQANQLYGRVFAIAGDPNVKNVRLPFILEFRRG